MIINFYLASMPDTRKVIKTGHSLALTLPSDFVDNFAIKEGDVALVSVNSQRSAITYTFTGHPQQLTLVNSKHR